MGLMTLLAKKINPDKKTQLRAPTYERKISTKSPVRLIQTVSPSGTIPNSNGSQGLEHTKAVHCPSSPLSRTSFSAENAAPAPVILGFRGDEALSRSKTSLRRRGTNAQRMGSTDPSIVSPGPSTRLSQLVIPRSRASLVISETQRTEQRTHAHQISISSSKIAKSIRSNGSRGYVDLLDAQSELKPSDFHGRIKAAGTRDYGEDVADRNIGVNGCNLDSQPVRAFYAVGRRAPSRASTLDRPQPSPLWAQRPESSDDDDYVMDQTRVDKQSSIDSALHSSLHGPSHYAHYENTLSRSVLNAAALQRSHALHNQALNTTQSKAPQDGLEECTLADIEALYQQQQELLSRRQRTPGQVGSTRDASKLASSHVVTLQGSGINSSAARPSTSESMSRHSSTFRKGSASAEKLEQGRCPPQLAVSSQPRRSAQPTPLRLSASLSNSALTTRSKRRPTTRNVSLAQLSHQSSFELHETSPDSSKLPYRVKETTLYIEEDRYNDLTDQESAPSPFIKKSRSRSRSRDYEYSYSHTNSCIPHQPCIHPVEMEDHASGHTNSIRHWSMSSTAPTTYSLSSATYGRPHSHHTAETSIDLSNASVPTNAKKFYGSKPGNKLSPHLSINGYVSSDSDSFLASQEDRSASEEDLLFTNGYGKNGMQLPGLGDTFAAPGAPAFLGASRSAYRRPSIESPQLSKSALQHTESDESLSLAGKSSRRKRSTKSAAPVSQRRNFQEEHGSRAQTFTKRYETKRLSALLEATTATGHSHYGDENASDSGQSIHAPDFCIGQRNNVAQQGVEEEKLEKLNIATAIRLRKEAKSKKRVSAMSVSSQSRGSGPVKTIEA